jgi:hypothetical protein
VEEEEAAAEAAGGAAKEEAEAPPASTVAAATSSIDVRISERRRDFAAWKRASASMRFDWYASTPAASGRGAAASWYAIAGRRISALRGESRRDWPDKK